MMNSASVTPCYHIFLLTLITIGFTAIVVGIILLGFTINIPGIILLIMGLLICPLSYAEWRCRERRIPVIVTEPRIVVVVDKQPVATK